MKTFKFHSNVHPTTATATTAKKNINSPDEEIGGSPQPSPSSEMLAEAKNSVSKPDFVGGEPVKEPKPVEEEGFWHQRKVQFRALVLFLATIGLIVAVSVDVVVRNGNGDAGSSGSNTPVVTGTTLEPSALCFDTATKLREAVDLYLTDNRSDSLVAIIYGWPIGDWCVSNIQDFSELFSVDRNPKAVNFNEDVSRWDVSHARTMRSMFAGSSDASTSFNQPLGDWDVSSVTDMSYMFHRAFAFDQTLADWDVSSAMNMSAMFYLSKSFNQPLEKWDVSSVTDMNRLFRFASSFNQPLADWDVSKVTDMNSMFRLASSFNQPLADWDVSSVTDMSNMFNYAFAWNQPLADWNVSSVTTMREMFRSALSFDQSLAGWDVSSVTDMYDMFYHAKAFNKSLADWNVSTDIVKSSIFGDSGCPGEVGQECCFDVCS
jgi:surface protein